MIWRVFISFPGFMSMIFVGCSKHSSDPSQDIVKELAPSTVLLKYRGGTIKASDLHDRIAPELEKLRDETTELYRREAEALALARVLEARARAEGFKNADEFNESLRAKIEIRETEVLDFMKRNHLPASSKEEAKKFLQNQAWVTKQAELKQSLLKDADLEWKITDAVHEFQGKGSIPPKGAPHARVVIHEFCDFSNPLCSPLRVAIEQILNHYPKDVSLYFHPISREDRPGSLQATLAAFCSVQQEKFWEMEGKLLDHQDKLNDETILGIAKELGLDMKRFQDCLADPKTHTLINDEQTQALARGIKETPALFVNGERIDSIDALSTRVSVLVEARKVSQ